MKKWKERSEAVDLTKVMTKGKERLKRFVVPGTCNHFRFLFYFCFGFYLEEKGREGKGRGRANGCRSDSKSKSCKAW